MRKTALFSALALLLAVACSSIPPQSPITCKYNIVVMSPGQSMESEPSESLPGYIDIVGVSSVLDGEVLTATFHLREIPRQMEVNRRGVPSGALEYLWVVAVSTVGDPYLSFHNFDYWLEASYTAGERDIERPPLLVDVESALEGHLLRYSKQSTMSTVAMGLAQSDVDVAVSHEDNTLTVSGRIRGIKSSSTIAFSAIEYHGASDLINCNGFDSQMPMWWTHRRIVP